MRYVEIAHGLEFLVWGYMVRSYIYAYERRVFRVSRAGTYTFAGEPLYVQV